MGLHDCLQNSRLKTHDSLLSAAPDVSEFGAVRSDASTSDTLTPMAPELLKPGFRVAVSTNLFKKVVMMNNWKSCKSLGADPMHEQRHEFANGSDAQLILLIVRGRRDSTFWVFVMISCCDGRKLGHMLRVV